MQSAVSLARKYWAELLLFLSSSGTYLYKLGSYRFFDGDEMIYHQVAHNINKTGDWLTMYWRFNPDGSLVEWFEKPPLIIWLKALLIRLPGQIEFWSRLPSALAGIGTVYLTYLIAKRLFDKTTGMISALIVLSAPGLLHLFRIGRLDGPLVFFFWLALYFALRLKDHPKFYYLFGASIGLAAMTKGATAVLIPAIVALAWIWNKELKQHLYNRHLWIGAAVAGVLTLPWHLAELVRHGNVFWNEYFGYHVWTRIKESIAGTAPDDTPIRLEGRKTSAYYITLLFRMFRPWAVMVPFAFGLAVRDTLRKRSASSKILIATILANFVFFSLLVTKVIHYTAPAYPALAILCAVMIRQALHSRAVAQLFVAASGLIAVFFLPWTISTRIAFAITVCLLALLIGTAFAFKGWFADRWRYITVGALAVFCLSAANTYRYELYNPAYVRNAQPVAELALAVKGTPVEPVIVYPFELETLSSFVVMTYADRLVLEVSSLGAMAQLMADGKSRPAILLNESISQLERRYDVQVLKSHQGYSLTRIKKSP